KAIERSATATADSDSFRPELVAEDEPRYLRRQKPVDVRRKKFGAKGWTFYRRLSLWILLTASLGVAAYFGADFALHSERVLLHKTEQIDLVGNHVVSRESLVNVFYPDRDRSVLRIPLEERREEIQRIKWVESASVQRILPNRLRVEITERNPVAFVRNGSEVALIDAHG